MPIQYRSQVDQITPSDTTSWDNAILIGKIKIKFILTIFQLH